MGKLAEGAADAAKVRQELEDSIYFVPADRRFENGVPVGDSLKWTLAVLRPIKWGIVGTGLITEDVVGMMDCLPGTKIVAVSAFKEEEKAKKFAEQHGGCNTYGTLEDLADDPDVDAA